MMTTGSDSDNYCDQAERLCSEDRFKEALSYVESALESDPEHLQSLVLAGDLYGVNYDELGIDLDVACETAISFFERAIRVEPRLSEAWSGKALALVYLGRYPEALCAAEEGFKVLPLRIGIENETIYVNIAESLFYDKVRALLGLGRKAGARKALSKGFEHCPGSSYLAHLLDEFAPRMSEPEKGTKDT